MLMYIHSRQDNVCKKAIRETRGSTKFEFKPDSKIGTKYGNSPFYRGTKLWNKLERDVQLSDNRWSFKNNMIKNYKHYQNIL